MGGSGGTFSRFSPSEIAQKIREEESKIDTAEFEMRLSAQFANLLGRYNDRDAALVRERIDAIKATLAGHLGDAVDVVFGGSVAKHTYVDGLSDVDSILILNDTPLEDRTPKRILDRLASLIQPNLGVGTKLTIGTIALTVEYPDGMAVQFLPGLRGDDHLKVPAWKGNEWSPINPEQFRQGLTKRNEECGHKLVPTIKLVKAINAELPERVQLSGYHIESLAIAAFRGYDGPRNTVKMVPHFFTRASELINRPMTDRTGQSVHVDADLGPADSALRRERSYVLQRIAKRMTNATAAQSMEQWLSLFGEAR